MAFLLIKNSKTALEKTALYFHLPKYLIKIFIFYEIQDYLFTWCPWGML